MPANFGDGNVYWVKQNTQSDPSVFHAVTVVAMTGAVAELLTESVRTSQHAGLSKQARPKVEWARAVCGPTGVASPAGEAVFWLPCRADHGAVSGATMYRAIKARVAGVIRNSTEVARRQAQYMAQAKKRAKRDGTTPTQPRLQYRLIGHTARSRQAERAPEDWSFARTVQSYKPEETVRSTRAVSIATLVGRGVAGSSGAEPSGAAAAAPEGSRGLMQGAPDDSQASAPSQRQLHDPQPHAAMPKADPDSLHGVAWKNLMLVEFTAPPAGFLFTMPDATLKARGEAWPHDTDPFAWGARGRSASREALSAWVAAGASDGRARVQRRTAESKPKPSLKRASRGS